MARWFKYRYDVTGVEFFVEEGSQMEARMHSDRADNTLLYEVDPETFLELGAAPAKLGKGEVIEKLTELDISFDPKAPVAELRALLPTE